MCLRLKRKHLHVPFCFVNEQGSITSGSDSAASTIMNKFDTLAISSRQLLSRRQKKRAFEQRYWENVHKNALRRLGRILNRQCKAEASIFAEFEAIVLQELAKQDSDAEFDIVMQELAKQGSEPAPIEKPGVVHRKNAPALRPKCVDDRYVEVCLVDALRAHRYKVPYTCNGPFWAMQDGNAFLSPWKQLEDML